MLNAEILRFMVRYDHETGEFFWVNPAKNNSLKGSRAGSLNKNGYWYISILGKAYLAHRLAWLYMTGAWPKNEIDHRDGNPSNNKFSNLRGASSRTNKENRSKAFNKLGLLGVYSYRDKFKAQICVNRKQIHLGVFDTKEDASTAYLTAKRTYHKGFIERKSP